MNTVLVGWLVFAAFRSVEARSPDDPASAPPIEVIGACPSRSAVVEALLPVLSRDVLRSGLGSTRVIDRGDRYEVSAAGQNGQYVDAARDCAERARVAAVFIGLALNPPSVPAAEPLPPPPPEPPAPGPPEPSPKASGAMAPAWKRLTAGARLDAAPSADGAPSDTTGGGELRGSIGVGALGFAVGGAALLPTTTMFDTISVRQQRFPFSLAVVLRGQVAPWLELEGQAGLALVFMTLRAENLGAATTSRRLDLGGRLAVQVTGPRLDGWSIFAALHAEYFPRPYVLDVDPRGKVGVTHHFWGGASIGVSFQRP